MKTLNEWKKAVHDNSVSKGWYENERNSMEMFMLMATEISEATEEVRKHKEHLYYEGEKPEGEAVELADLMIRIFDYAQYKNIDLDKYVEREFDYLFGVGKRDLSDLNKIGNALNKYKKHKDLPLFFKNFLNAENPIEKHMILNMNIAKAAEEFYLDVSEEESFYLTDTIFLILFYFKENKWNIEEILDIKHNYNKTRPFKHGGKKC